MTLISMKEWLNMNQRTRVLPTDKWYLDFAIKILPFIKQSSVFKDEDSRTQAKAAILVSLYFQDAISQNGGWKVFSNQYLKQYGKRLPFYLLTDDYTADEINPEDIAFVIWTLKSERVIEEDDTFTFFNPYDENLLLLSQTLYGMMDACFEEAPISNQSSADIWVMGADVLEVPNTPLPEIIPGTKLKKDVERCLEYNQGKPLLYFANYQKLRTFFVEVLKWEDHPSSLLSDLEDYKEFVIYANAKGILVAHSVAAYFCEEHNPLYNAQRAATEGYKMFCHPGVCPFDLLKYGMAKGILPDIQLPFPKGKEFFQQQWDFIARYYLGEYYEGE